MQAAVNARLHVYQSLWGMEELPWRGDAAWTVDEQLDRVAEAGFDGVSLSFADAEPARKTAAKAIARGLRLQAMCIPATVDELEAAFDTIEAVGREHVDHVNVQPDVRPRTLEEGVPYLLGWQTIADERDVPLYVETHRHRMTTDLLFTLRLLDAVPSLQLTADLSHFVVGQELALPVSDADHALIRRILQRSGAYHGRVASCEQIQVQSGFAHHRRWRDLFAGWWLEGFRHFRATGGADEVLTFTIELGPPSSSYALTGPDGEELSDRWAEALELADLARRLWGAAATDAPAVG